MQYGWIIEGIGDIIDDETLELMICCRTFPCFRQEMQYQKNIAVRILFMAVVPTIAT